MIDPKVVSLLTRIQTGSYTRAAKELCLSQPAGSHQDVYKRQVIVLGEQEADADILQQAGAFLGGNPDVHPQGLQHVGRPALARGRPVAVLGHRHPRRRDDQGGGGGDVEGVGADVYKRQTAGKAFPRIPSAGCSARR